MALHYVVELDALEQNKPILFEIEGRCIGLIKTDQEVYAIRNVCPHKAAPICKGTVRGTMLPSAPDTFVFGLENQVLQCPWHGWEFDLKTGTTLCPSKKRLRRYAVVLRDRAVYVEL
jgi:nitrite reductase (NADH) small subunit